MLPMSGSAVWMGGDEDDATSWTRSSNNNNNNNNEGEPKNEQQSSLGASFSNFKSMLEGDWYMNNVLNPTHHQDLHSLPNHRQPDIRDIACFSENTLMLQPMDSSASCSPSQAFSLDPSPPQHLFRHNPFDNGFDLGCDSGFLSSFQGNQPSNSSALMGFTALNSQFQMGTPELSSSAEFPTTRLLPAPNNDTELERRVPNHLDEGMKTKIKG